MSIIVRKRKLEMWFSDVRTLLWSAVGLNRVKTRTVHVTFNLPVLLMMLA